MDDPYYQYPSTYYQHPHPQQPPPPPGTTFQAPPPPTVVQPLPIPQYHPHQPPPPPIPAYAPPIYEQQHSHDELRTLFVAGLPADVKPREIYNLFREFPGYESSHLRSPTSNTQPFAFAVFADQHSALMAMHELNGMAFDLEKESTLYINLAKSNSKSKRLRTDEGRLLSEKRIKGSAAISWDSDSGLGSVHMPGMGNSAYNMIGYPPTQSQGRFDGRFVNEATNKRSADPCPTLFVANLGQNCSEQELIQVFSRCQGFLKLKMQSTYGAPVAFVDFQDTASSTEALSHLQGTILYSSPSGEGMRLEYAKSRMGKRSKKSS